MNKFRGVFFALFAFFLLSCAPVLRKDIMDTAIRDFSMSDLGQNPSIHEGKLFVLGGVIINTKASAEGSLIEALYVPVNARGYLIGTDAAGFRFLALFPKESGFIDPVIFERNREITLAGEFEGFRQGKIDEMDYSYPFFRIREIYLWEEREEYYYYPDYYPDYYDPFRGGYSHWWYGRPYFWHDRPYRWHGSPYWW